MGHTKKLPLLPLRGVLVFPYMIMHLDVGREQSVKALETAMEGDNQVLLVAQKEAEINTPGEKDLYHTGTVAQIKQMIKLPEGNFRVLVEGVYRGKIKNFLCYEPYLETEVEVIDEVSSYDTQTEALMRHLRQLFEEFMKNSKKISPETLASVSSITEAGRLADMISSHLSLDLEKKQEILEAFPTGERLEKLGQILSRELEIQKIEGKIDTRVKEQMESTQKEYYLREQIKAIQRELGEEDSLNAEASEYRKRISDAELPEKVEEKALKELDRLQKMPPAAAEGVVIRNYLDWLLELPWYKSSHDTMELEDVQRVLDEDHYGMEKVKNRIIEYLAVRHLTRQIKGPILCLVGPPGVGKTSLARSIARSMEREFVRVTLGGVRDEAEIRGHRRTYVGALPGRIIQGINQAGTRNPVFLLDEVDKMSTDFRGDPSAALLEVLDPEQNCNFSDHFIEVSFDLSQVMFITTANTTYNIPPALLDRMETIYISGYTEEEKLKISQRHLIPKQLQENGMTHEHLQVSENALRDIIRRYTREAGVRNLERNLATVCRKIAREVIRDENYCLKLNQKNLRRYLGIPRYRYGSAEEKDQVGVAAGLGWTETGGELLPVEVSLMKGSGKMILTGKMGDTMQESAQAAMSYIRSRSDYLGLSPGFYQEIDIHLHIPEGAIPKDGPSAGIVMASALVSALIGVPVSSQVALTGEITLRGRVLPVGGIKEKVLAAHRAGIRKVIISRDNRKDKSEIPAQVARKIELVEAETMDEVLGEALVGFEPANPGENISKRHQANISTGAGAAVSH